MIIFLSSLVLVLLTIYLTSQWFMHIEKGCFDRTHLAECFKNVFLMGVALVLIIASNDLILLYIGFLIFSLMTGGRLTLNNKFSHYEKVPERTGILKVRTVIALFLSLSGVLVIAFAGQGTNFSSLGTTLAAQIGIVLFFIGIVANESHKDPILFLCRYVSIFSVLVRVFKSSPHLADKLDPVFWFFPVTLIALGSIRAMVHHDRTGFLNGLTLFNFGIAIMALPSGSLLLPNIFVHIVVSSLTIACLRVGRILWIQCLMLLSASSVPPFPGFVTKLSLFGGLSSTDLAVAAMGTIFISMACVAYFWRVSLIEDRFQKGSKALLGIVVVGMSIMFGLFPDMFLNLAERAIESL